MQNTCGTNVESLEALKFIFHNAIQAFSQLMYFLWSSARKKFICQQSLVALQVLRDKKRRESLEMSLRKPQTKAFRWCCCFRFAEDSFECSSREEFLPRKNVHKMCISASINNKKSLKMPLPLWRAPSKIVFSMDGRLNRFWLSRKVSHLKRAEKNSIAMLNVVKSC